MSSNLGYSEILKRLSVLTDSDPWKNLFLVFVDLEIESLRDSLENCVPDRVAPIQNQIRVWRRLLTLGEEITRLRNEEPTNG